MQVNHTQELPNGVVKFEGVLEGKELEFVLKMGLHALMLAGAFNSQMEAGFVMPEPTQAQ